MQSKHSDKNPGVNRPFLNSGLARGRQLVAGIPNKALVYFLKHKWIFILGFCLILFGYIRGVAIKNSVMIIVLILVASFSTYYKKYVKFTLGFELVTFATVLTTVAYGPMVGALVGFVSSIAAEVIPQLIDPSSFFWIISLPVSAFVVAFFSSMGVPLFWLGFISIATQFMISEPIRIFSGDSYLKTMGTVNIVTTAAWTVLWFKLLAPAVLPLM
ncbi:hypothetical protein HYY72_02215 [Candidatus Woesearchaeota archaeon]|nr:hypothetical protein [Candidatus Woesearchaeota archaeon]